MLAQWQVHRFARPALYFHIYGIGANRLCRGRQVSPADLHSAQRFLGRDCAIRLLDPRGCALRLRAIGNERNASATVCQPADGASNIGCNCSDHRVAIDTRLQPFSQSGALKPVPLALWSFPFLSRNVDSETNRPLVGCNN
jgi:hypothetical protein